MSQSDPTSKFPRLKPIKSPPAMFRVNGCGVALYGSRDHDAETGSYVATWCLSLVFVPVLALRAYRVARASRGWYFMGREPLSGVAKGWNLALLAAILGTVGVVQYNAYTGTPAYRAKHEMAAAHDLASKGEIAQAGKIYQGLALGDTEQTDPAAAALDGLLNNECQQATLRECAGVYAADVPVVRRRHVPPAADVAAKAVKLVTERGDVDPSGALAILDAVRPLVIDTRSVDATRLPLLRKWAAREPSNLAALTPLASLLEQQGKLDEAKKLLLPVKDKLGDGEGARVLGVILGRQGDYDGSYALLWPYVKSRLDNLHAAEKTFDSTFKRLESRELGLLNSHKAPDEFYEKYERATTSERHAQVQEYLGRRIRADAGFISAQAALEHETGVVPVALELGIVMLQRAQGQTSPDVRKSQLESAEQVFLAVRGVAGETDEYRLTLGQVDYWLGKQADGRKLFDEYLVSKGRGFKYLLEIAGALRQLGAVPEARTLAEEAYGKATNAEERFGAAQFRSLCDTDNDDKIAWLNKSDTTDNMIKATLAKALGDQAMQSGNDTQAARQYRAAIDVYAAMPRSAGTLNETALAYYGIFFATGDHAALERCLDYFQQAVDLSPSDSILLYNAGTTLLSGAIAEVIGDAIDLRALHDTAGVSLLGHLYHDQAGRDALAARVKDHPGVARALSYLNKVAVLSPKNARAFEAMYSLYQFTRDEAALRLLAQRAREAGFDSSDDVREMKDYVSGSKDPQTIARLTAALKRSDDLATALRSRADVTAAVALDQQARGILSLDALTGSGDLDKAVQRAEEAMRLSPSASSRGMLSAALMSRAVRDLRRGNAAFDGFYKQYGRSTGAVHLVAAALAEPGPLQGAVSQNADVKRTIAMTRKDLPLYTNGGSPYDWAILKSVDPGAAEQIAAKIRGLPRKQVEQSIESLLEPASASQALEEYWLCQILGKPNEGRAALQRVAAAGIPVPIKP